MPKATVYRTLATLEIRGYLDRNAEVGYKVSDELFSLHRDVSVVVVGAVEDPQTGEVAPKVGIAKYSASKANRTMRHHPYVILVYKF